MDGAFRAWAAGGVQQPLRAVVPLPAGLFFVMPAVMGPFAGVKTLTQLPANALAGRPVIQGMVILFDASTGEPRALLDAASLTAIRTAAVSALATRHMARDDAHVLAILGSGVQARTHLDAISTVRDVREIRVWSRSPERSRAFADSVVSAQQSVQLSVQRCDSARDAVRGADIVCCVTASSVPLLASADLADGTHVNAVGAHNPATRELDGTTIARSRFIVDSRDAALAESGELRLGVAEGAFAEAHVAGELGDVVTGRIAGRLNERELTVFKSLGLAMEDVAAAAAVFEAACASSDAVWVEL